MKTDQLLVIGGIRQRHKLSFKAALKCCGPRFSRLGDLPVGTRIVTMSGTAGRICRKNTSPYRYVECTSQFRYCPREQYLADAIVVAFRPIKEESVRILSHRGRLLNAVKCKDKTTFTHKQVMNSIYRSLHESGRTAN